MTIDTLAAAKALERAGMENGHAEAVAGLLFAALKLFN